MQSDPVERLKVLFITAWYPTKELPFNGIFIREHAKAVRLYDDVVVIHSVGLDRQLTTAWQLVQETDEALTDRIPTYHLSYRPSLVPKTSILIFLAAALGAYRRLAAAGFRPDIIHANIHDVSLVSVLLGKLYRVPVVASEHSTAFMMKRMSRRDAWNARLAFGWANAVLPDAQALRCAIEQYGIRAHFQVVPNVVDTHLFGPPSSPHRLNEVKRLLTVCFLDPLHKKGIPFLLRALAQLRQKRNDWHLDIVGDGPAREEYEHLAVDLGISDFVTFCGAKPKSQVAEYMRQADLFILPSLWENMPSVIIEAMACGLPIVSTTAGDIREIVDDEIGIVVPPGDTAQLLSAIERILLSLNNYDRKSISRRAQRYSPQIVGYQSHTIYKSFQR
jgi:glycosyltransferase involved in cell wall biosynthesis